MTNDIILCSYEKSCFIYNFYNYFSGALQQNMCVTAFLSFLSEQASCTLTIKKCFSCSQNISPQLYSGAIRCIFHTGVVATQLQNVFTPIKLSSVLWESQKFNKKQLTNPLNVFWIIPLGVSWIQACLWPPKARESPLGWVQGICSHQTFAFSVLPEV